MPFYVSFLPRLTLVISSATHVLDVVNIPHLSSILPVGLIQSLACTILLVVNVLLFMFASASQSQFTLLNDPKSKMLAVSSKLSWLYLSLHEIHVARLPICLIEKIVAKWKGLSGPLNKDVDPVQLPQASCGWMYGARSKPDMVVHSGRSDFWSLITTNQSLESSPRSDFIPKRDDSAPKLATRGFGVGETTWVIFSSKIGPFIASTLPYFLFLVETS